MRYTLFLFYQQIVTCFFQSNINDNIPPTPLFIRRIFGRLVSLLFFFFLILLEYKKMQQNESVVHIRRATLFKILFPCRSLQSTEQSFLCYMVGPYQLRKPLVLYQGNMINCIMCGASISNLLTVQAEYQDFV